MDHVWQLQEAKSKLSELVNRALGEGPQIITRHGEEVVVVISYEDYNQMRKPKTSLVEFLRTSPLAVDSLIAATALQGGFILVTRNPMDFENTGAQTYNPWV
jgi:antitoxin Phd